MRLVRVLVAVVMVAGPLISCSDSGGGKGSSVRRSLKPRQQQNPDEGEAAQMNLLTTDNVVTSPFYGKKYDRNDLDAVMRASPRATAQYVQALGVALYKNDSDAAEAPTFAFLPSVSDARGATKAVWDNFASDIPEGAELLGLYFEATPADDRNMHDPTIIVLESSSRWTLLHEQMHHNFNKERKHSEGLVTSAQLRPKLKEMFASTADAKNQFKADGSQASLKKYAVAFDSLVQTVQVYAEQYSTLEEIAVDGVLMEEWSTRRLQYVTDDSAEGAIWYSRYSRGTAFEAIGLDELKGQAGYIESQSQSSEITVLAGNSRRILNTIEAEGTEAVARNIAKYESRGGKLPQALVALATGASIDRAEGVLLGIEYHQTPEQRELERVLDAGLNSLRD